ncbi:hypothetical protein ACLBXM_02670 [Xanthobacteraceae bacterium A53D]
MQVYQMGDWRSLLKAASGAVLSVFIVIFAIQILLYIIKYLIGEANFPTITIAVAVVGSLIALYQFSSSVRDKKKSQAKALATATGLSKDLIKLCTAMDKTERGFVGAHPTEIDASRMGIRREWIQQIALAMQQLDAKDLPSAQAIRGLIRARAAANTAAKLSSEAATKGQSIDMEPVLLDAIPAVEILEKERDRLYPIHRMGPVNVAVDVERQ